MRILIRAFSALALALAIGGSALAQEYVKGEVVKVDAKQKKLTIKHEPLTNLDMPAMT
ncbi:MAG: copper-binding protein, partial [Mesorhizobium sp.]